VDGAHAALPELPYEPVFVAEDRQHRGDNLPPSPRRCGAARPAPRARRPGRPRRASHANARATSAEGRGAPAPRGTLHAKLLSGASGRAGGGTQRPDASHAFGAAQSSIEAQLGLHVPSAAQRNGVQSTSAPLASVTV
jgi:hypothetical protein